MKFKHFVAFAALLLCAGTTAFAQTTASLTGEVNADGTPLPGVTVTISSPAMQGVRTTTTGENGGYNFTALPPGRYSVRFELAGMANVTREAQVSLSQSARADANMSVAGVAEAITVTASAPTALETSQVSTNVSKQLVDRWAASRSPRLRNEREPRSFPRSFISRAARKYVAGVGEAFTIASSVGSRAEREARTALGSESRPRVPALIMLARLLARQDNLDEALTVANRAVARVAEEGAHPVPTVESTRGDILARMGRNAEAETAFRAEIARFPATTDSYVRLALISSDRPRTLFPRTMTPALVFLLQNRERFPSPPSRGDS